MLNVKIGVVTQAVGLRGEVKVKSFAESPDRFSKVGRVLLERKGKSETYDVEYARMSGSMVVLKLKGVDDRDAAERLRSCEISMDEDELEELPEDTFYVKDLIGLDAKDADTGDSLGTVKNVLTDRPQDLYVVERPGKKDLLIPAVSEFIKEIDPDKGRILLRLIEGME